MTILFLKFDLREMNISQSSGALFYGTEVAQTSVYSLPDGVTI
jgi:hypothetical protein